MDIEKRVKIVLTEEDIIKACKAFVQEELHKMNQSMMPMFESFNFDFDKKDGVEFMGATITYKGA